MNRFIKIFAILLLFSLSIFADDMFIEQKTNRLN